MIDATNRNTLWASILADELARHGVTHAVIAPGSRSTPLAVAFSRDERFTVHSALDERGAAFFALGIGMATARPAVLVCTSGTAAANFFPAIIEANQSGVPLLALTADRPADLRGSGANQTIDQVRLYGGHVRWFVELPEPAANPPDRTLRSLRTTICRAVAAATGRSGGPVHINVPLRKPLEPVPVAGDVPAAVLAGIGARGRAAGEPFMAVHTERLAPLDEIELRPLTDAIRGSTRGLIICGRGLVDPGPLVRVAQQTGFPTLVEPFCPTRLSPAATREHQLILGGYETFLRGALAAALKPDLIVRFGDPPVGKALLDYTEQHADVEQIVVTPRTHRLDSALTTTAAIPHEPKAVLLALIDQRVGATVDRAWQAAFVQAEALTQAATAAMHRAHPHEGTVVADVFALAPARAAVFAANSTIIRHVDQFALGGQGQFVYANRGASGIDGNVATAVGLAHSYPTTLIIGDVALYHDLNSLHLIRRLGIPLVIVCINNDGGGIFHRLPIAAHEPPFRELFVTPHGLTFAHAAALFDIPYTRAEPGEAFRGAYRTALETGGPHLIEVPSDAAAFENQRRALIEEVHRRIEAAEIVTKKE